VSEPQAISPIKLNAQIGEIEQQRNTALTRCSKLAGDNAELIDLVRILRAENERLEGVVKRQSELLPSEIDRAGAVDAEPAHQTH
jgi:hypothetical protein